MEDRILIVDDEKMIYSVIARRLSQEGFPCVMANNGREALGYFYKNNFSLGFDWMAVLDAVHGKNARMPVIILTGTGSEEIAVESMKRGASDYVIKSPHHIQRLPQTIQAVLEKQHMIEERIQAEEALRRSAAELLARNEELERWRSVTVDRELRMVELKREVNELCGRLGEVPRYKIPGSSRKEEEGKGNHP